MRHGVHARQRFMYMCCGMGTGIQLAVGTLARPGHTGPGGERQEDTEHPCWRPVRSVHGPALPEAAQSTQPAYTGLSGGGLGFRASSQGKRTFIKVVEVINFPSLSVTM